MNGGVVTTAAGFALLHIVCLARLNAPHFAKGEIEQTSGVSSSNPAQPRKKDTLSGVLRVAGLGGVEPPRRESKSRVLPLDYSPLFVQGHLRPSVPAIVGWEMGFEPTIFSATN